MTEYVIEFRKLYISFTDLLPFLSDAGKKEFE